MLGSALQPLDKASIRVLGCVNLVVFFLNGSGGENVGFRGEQDFSMTFPTSILCFTMKSYGTSPETPLLHIGSPTPDLGQSDPQSDSAGLEHCLWGQCRSLLEAVFWALGLKGDSDWDLPKDSA